MQQPEQEDTRKKNAHDTIHSHFHNSHKSAMTQELYSTSQEYARYERHKNDNIQHHTPITQHKHTRSTTGTHHHVDINSYETITTQADNTTTGTQYNFTRKLTQDCNNVQHNLKLAIQLTLKARTIDT
jgi:hypothetical protein